jgi:hypothetical protein
MAKTEVAATDMTTGEVIGYADDPSITWDTVHVEAGDQVVFELEGDTYIGRYAGHEIIYPDREKEPLSFFVQVKWTDPQGSKFTNAGHDLANAYVDLDYNADGSLASHTDKVPIGAMTRTEMRKTVDTGKKDPMKSYRVDVARLDNADNSA